MSIRLAVKSIRIRNFKCYEDYSINMSSDSGDGVFLVYGLFGPNGSGKTTVLDALSLVFSSFSSYTEQRIEIALRKYIRNFKFLSPSEQTNANFLIEADIASDIGDYKVCIDKHGYLEGNEHPEEIKKEILTKCFRTRYDEELNTFQLRLDRWEIFKDLFETVTGYKVDKKECPMSPFTIMDESSVSSLANLNEYVLALEIRKPNEIITDRECSKGEKKIIKNFTTLLNKDKIPSVILIDDVEMHVEINRHLSLINCIEKCFPESQVIFTTHSPLIIHGFDVDRLNDLTVKLFCEEKWRKKAIRFLNKITFFCDDAVLKKKTTDLVEKIRLSICDKQNSLDEMKEILLKVKGNDLFEMENI